MPPLTNRPSSTSLPAPRRTPVPPSPITSGISELLTPNEVPGIGTISPKLEQLRKMTALADNYGIAMNKANLRAMNANLSVKMTEKIVETARRIESLRQQYGTDLKVGDPIPGQGDGTLRNYSHYFEDLPLDQRDVDVLSDPNATGFGGGYSYRGKDPYAEPQALYGMNPNYKGSSKRTEFPEGVPSPESQALIANPFSADVLTAGTAIAAKAGISVVKGIAKAIGRKLTTMETKYAEKIGKQLREESRAYYQKGQPRPAQRYLDDKGNIVEIPEGLYD